MEQTIEVATANYAIGSSPQVLVTRGVGSCAVVCLYANLKKTGALVHIMLPNSGGREESPLRFVDTALPIVLEALAKKGVSVKELEATLVGGASMFTQFEDLLSLGNKNIRAVKEFLKKENIIIKNQEVGGNRGRNIQFVLETGSVQTTTT